jgi:hypothetical protein
MMVGVDRTGGGVETMVEIRTDDLEMGRQREANPVKKPVAVGVALEGDLYRFPVRPCSRIDR